MRGIWTEAEKSVLQEDKAAQLAQQADMSLEAVQGVAFLGDGNQKGVFFFWSERRGSWLVCDLDRETCKHYDDLALVTLRDENDPEYLNQMALGCDLETPAGLWLVSSEDLSELHDLYEDDLIIRANTAEE